MGPFRRPFRTSRCARVRARRVAAFPAPAVTLRDPRDAFTTTRVHRRPAATLTPTTPTCHLPPPQRSLSGRVLSSPPPSPGRGDYPLALSPREGVAKSRPRKKTASRMRESRASRASGAADVVMSALDADDFPLDAERSEILSDSGRSEGGGGDVDFQGGHTRPGRSHTLLETRDALRTRARDLALALAVERRAREEAERDLHEMTRVAELERAECERERSAHEHTRERMREERRAAEEETARLRFSVEVERAKRREARGELERARVVSRKSRSEAEEAADARDVLAATREEADAARSEADTARAAAADAVAGARADRDAAEERHDAFARAYHRARAERAEAIARLDAARRAYDEEVSANAALRSALATAEAEREDLETALAEARAVAETRAVAEARAVADASETIVDAAVKEVVRAGMKDATAAADATRRATKSAEANALEAEKRAGDAETRLAETIDAAEGSDAARFVAERAEVDALDDLARAKATAGVVADARGTRGGRAVTSISERVRLRDALDEARRRVVELARAVDGV